MVTNEDFIQKNRQEDVRKLALRKGPDGVDMTWCLQQIEGWQLAQKKLPRWAQAEDALWFPPRLSMEQCSSESTALYKRKLLERLLSEGERGSFVDLTGGFGIDFSYLAPLFRRATYVERQAHLCEIARHNLPLLELSYAEVVNADCEQLSFSADVIFMDPARRDVAGRKTVAIEDCTPNVVEMQDELLSHTRYLIIKLSPMLDIVQALRTLHHVMEVHVISVKGECKELLLVLGQEGHGVTYYCANLETEDELLVCTEQEKENMNTILMDEMSQMEGCVFEPNASVLKAACQDALCQKYGLRKLHPCSNLFVGLDPIQGFPGRQFRVDAYSDFSKKGLKQLISGITQGNLTIRNFPATVADLRKKLKMRDGGEWYFFATTIYEGSHLLLRCRKV